MDISEKDRLIRNRDILLENSALDTRRLNDLLEKERQLRKQERHAFETAQRGSQSLASTIQQHKTHVLELETARNEDRRKLLRFEQQYKDQLLERHNLLLAIWNRLSTLCGPEWAREHTLINGELPSLDVLSRHLSGFSKNIILSVKTVEGIVGNFRVRIRNIERDLWKDFQTLEHNLETKAKRLEVVEKAVASRRSVSRNSSHSETSSEFQKIRSENKLLKAELAFHRQTTGFPRSGSPADMMQPIPFPMNVQPNGSHSGSRSPRSPRNAPTLNRHHTETSVAAFQQASPPPTRHLNTQHPLPQLQPQQQQPNETRWVHRLKELERRLKAEREARLTDRSGARKRLEERSAENEELRLQLERERERGRLSQGPSLEDLKQSVRAGAER